jgi:hypothetical protein
MTPCCGVSASDDISKAAACKHLREFTRECDKTVDTFLFSGYSHVALSAISDSEAAPESNAARSTPRDL